MAAWQNEQGSFALSASGDNIFVYCKRNDETINFLSGVTYTSGGWLDDSNTSGLSSSTSKLPKDLDGEDRANIALDHRDNYRYIGERNGSRSGLIREISNINNWGGSNSDDFDISGENFNVSEGNASGSLSTVTTNFGEFGAVF